MGIELNANFYGTHNLMDVFLNSFKMLEVFVILFIVGFLISRKINRKTFKINNFMYLILFIFYIIISLIKANVISNLPPHDLRKDLCGFQYSIIQCIIAYNIPIIYTLIMSIYAITNKIKVKNKSKEKK